MIEPQQDSQYPVSVKLLECSNNLPLAIGSCGTDSSPNTRSCPYNKYIDRMIGRKQAHACAAASLLSLFPALNSISSSELSNGLVWMNDVRGKPCIEFSGALAAAAQSLHIPINICQVSNSNDTGRHSVAMVCSPLVIGIGADIVYIPRLLGANKGSNYIHRLARRFMSQREYEIFVTDSVADTPYELVKRLTVHFSIMEAVSKAFGVGLKMGVGMGGLDSFKPKDICVKTSRYSVDFELEGSAAQLASDLTVNTAECIVRFEESYVTSLVILFRLPNEDIL